MLLNATLALTGNIIIIYYQIAKDSIMIECGLFPYFYLIQSKNSNSALKIIWIHMNSRIR